MNRRRVEEAVIDDAIEGSDVHSECHLHSAHIDGMLEPGDTGLHGGG